MKHPKAINTFPPERGFTLVEILVSVLVLSIGLLGLASLQVAGLKNNQSSYYRSQATMLAYDIADRIRANPDATYAATIGAAPSGGSNCFGTGAACNSVATTATFDINQWKCSLGKWNTETICDTTLRVEGDLPLGDGSVAKNGDIYTITIMWDDQRQGVTGTACGGNPTVDLTCFTMTFRS